jgi:anterior pharynx defective protein 1
MSLLFSSILWSIVVPLRDDLAFGVTFAVLFQEVFRYLFYRLLRRAEAGLQKVSEVGAAGAITPLNRLSLAYVAGLGFGIMSGACSLVNVLADAYGPGTVGIKGDPSNFFVVSAFTTLAFILMHTFWGVIFFQSLDQNQYIKASYVVLSHLAVSQVTLINRSHLYAVSVPVVYLFMIVSGFVAYISAGGTFKKKPPTPASL